MTARKRLSAPVSKMILMLSIRRRIAGNSTMEQSLEESNITNRTGLLFFRIEAWANHLSKYSKLEIGRLCSVCCISPRRAMSPVTSHRYNLHNILGQTLIRRAALHQHLISQQEGCVHHSTGGRCEPTLTPRQNRETNLGKKTLCVETQLIV